MRSLSTSLCCLLLQLLLWCSLLLFSLSPVLLSWLLLLPSPTLAPVPRCGPLIIINKVEIGRDLSDQIIWCTLLLFQVPDAVSILSDLNPFFPVPPCEYGGPLQALRAGDYESVFGGLPGQVDHLPLFPKGQLARHNLLEVSYYSFIIDIAGK